MRERKSGHVRMPRLSVETRNRAITLFDAGVSLSAIKARFEEEGTSVSLR